MNRFRVTLEFVIDMKDPEMYGPALSVDTVRSRIENDILRELRYAAEGVTNARRGDPGAVGFAYYTDRG